MLITLRRLLPIGAALLLAALPLDNQAQEKKAAPDKLSPDEAAKSFKTPGGLAFDQVLSEPIVRQPISISFDERSTSCARPLPRAISFSIE